MTVKAYDPKYVDNGELIAAVAQLGYLNHRQTVLDLTYGKGVWWNRFRPRYLTTNDKSPKVDADFHEDFTCTDWEAGSFDVVAFDPPYVSPGGRTTSTLGDFNQRYGLAEAAPSPAALQQVINDGLIECRRLLVPRKGLTLVKCMSYISSGKLWDGEQKTKAFADAIGYTLLDEFVYTSDEGGAQPKRNLDGSKRRQVHARNNKSVLLILRRA